MCRRRLAALLLGLSLFFGVAAQAAAQLRFQVDQTDITATVGDVFDYTLPIAEGGTGALTYTLQENIIRDTLPTWLAFVRATRRLIGSPTTTMVVNTAATATLTYTATDDNTAVLQMFTVTVRPGFANIIDDQAWYEGVPIDDLVLPAATGGTPTSYTLADPSGTLPDGLTFTAATRTLSGTPTTLGATTLTYTTTVNSIPATLMFDVTVTSAFANAIDDQTWTVDVAIDNLVLPAARGGTDSPTYTLAGPSGALPDGLIFDEPRLTLSGTPTTLGATTLTYTREVDGALPATLMFTVTVEAERRAVDADVHRAILPQVARAMTDSVVDAISGRIQQAADSAATAGPAFRLGGAATLHDALATTAGPAFRLGGAETLHDALAATAGPAFRPGGNATRYDALTAHAPAAAIGALDLPRLLNGSSFVLPLNAVDNGTGNPTTALAFWGRGDYRNLEGDGALNWDGGLASAVIGLDGRPRPDMLLGVALAYSDGAFDYDTADTAGEYDITMTSVHPYLGWSLPHGISLWATAGYGQGEIEVAEAGSAASSNDADLRSVALGASGQLLSAEGWLNMPGTTALRLKSEASATRIDVNGGGNSGGGTQTFSCQSLTLPAAAAALCLVQDETGNTPATVTLATSGGAAMAAPDLSVDVTRFRLALEGTNERVLASGAAVSPSLELGLRYDGGDGESGAGLELGGGVRYTNAATGLSVEGKARVLVGRDDYDEWGVQGSLAMQPGADGQGLSFSLSPGYGDSGGGLQRLWRQDLPEDGDDNAAADYRARLEARLGYGFAFALNGHDGMLTPYSELTLGATNRYRVGMNWKAGTRFDLTLLGERREPSTAPAEHAILLKGEVRF